MPYEGPDAVAERFWPKVEMRGSDECWPWRAAIIGGGYGGFWVRTEQRLEQYAHRAAFFITHGRWPEPCCLHSCDNPPCCNPAHLREGDQALNAKDRALRGRGTGRVILTQDQVDEIRVERGRTTQVELARRFGVSQTHVSNIQLGKSRRR